MGEKARERVLSLSRTPSPSSFFALAVLPANPVFRVATKLRGTDPGEQKRAKIVSPRFHRGQTSEAVFIFLFREKSFTLTWKHQLGYVK